VFETRTSQKFPGFATTISPKCFFSPLAHVTASNDSNKTYGVTVDKTFLITRKLKLLRTNG